MRVRRVIQYLLPLWLALLIVRSASAHVQALPGPLNNAVRVRKLSGIHRAPQLQPTSTVPLAQRSSALAALKSFRQEASEMGQQLHTYLWRKQPLQNKLSLLISFVLLLAHKRITVQVPFLLTKAITNLVQFQASHAPELLQAAVKLVVMFAGAQLVQQLLSEVRTVLVVYTMQEARKQYSQELFQHVHALDTDVHLKTPSGEIISSAARGVKGMKALLQESIFILLPHLVEMLFVTRMLFHRVGMRMALMTCATFVVYAAFTSVVAEWRVSIRQKQNDVENARDAHLVDTLLNQENVKLFSNTPMEAQTHEQYLKQIQKLQHRQTYSLATLNIGQEIIFDLGLLTILRSTISTMTLSDIGNVVDIAAIVQMLSSIREPFRYLGWTYQEVRQAWVDILHARRLQKQQPQVVDTPGAIDMPHDTPGRIEFRNVSLHYPNTSHVSLQNVSFVVEPGTTLAVLGPSGAGKSTIVKLLTRLYEPTSGSILIDGVDIRNYTLRSLRANIGVIPQDTILFDDTIEYNIRYGNVFATEQQIQEAVRQSGLDSALGRLGQGLATEVGERGTRLSGGERQRIAIARALLKDPRIMLCDEATASVDPSAEVGIVKALRNATRQRTTITIAHRLASIESADRLLVIDKGAVVEFGTHEELLQQSHGFYASMWKHSNGSSNTSSVPPADD